MSAGATGPVLSLRLPNRLAAIGETADEIALFCESRGVPPAAIGHLNLALDEAMTTPSPMAGQMAANMRSR